MSIQQSINQALGIGALLASQSPMAAAHKEKVLNQAAIKDADKANEASKIALNKQFKANEKTDPVTNKLATETAKNTAQAYKEVYKLNPTQYNYKKWANAQGIADISEGITQHKYKIVPFDKDYMQATQQANKQEMVAKQQKLNQRSKMGFETRKSMILDQYANPLEVKNER